MRVTIGLSYEAKSTERAVFQEWAHSRGINVYAPHTLVMPLQNWTSYYRHDEESGDGYLDFKVGAINALKSEEGPLFFHYGRYQYETNPKSVSWSLGSHDVSQDQISDEDMAMVFRNTLNYLLVRGVKSPWILVDESPAIGSPEWNSKVETRITRLVNNAVKGGWQVGVCSHISQLSYWLKVLKAQRWILPYKYDWERFKPWPPCENAELWFYNATNKRSNAQIDGLAERMKRLGVTGYLHWSFSSDVGTRPLGDVVDDKVVLTEDGVKLLNEIAIYSLRYDPTLKDPHERLKIIERIVLGRSPRE